MILLFIALLFTSQIHGMKLSEQNYVPQKKVKNQFEFMSDIRAGFFGPLKDKIDRQEVDVNCMISPDALNVEEWAKNKLPLHLALRQRKIAITTLLLASGAALVPFDNQPLTHVAFALALDCKHKHQLLDALQVLDLLLAYGGSVVDKGGELEETLLHKVARYMITKHPNAQKIFLHIINTCFSSSKLFAEEVKSARMANAGNIALEEGLTIYADKMSSFFMHTNKHGKTVLDVACSKACTTKLHSKNCKRYYFTQEYMHSLLKQQCQ